MVRKQQETGRVLFNRQIAPGIFQISAVLPTIAQTCVPGQFVQVRVCDEPSVQFLRMPFAISDADVKTGTVDICYQVVGSGTKQLTHIKPDDLLDCVGPIGNGWHIPQSAKRALIVCGGVGAPALNMLAQDLAKRAIVVDAVMAATTATRIVCRDTIEKAVDASRGTLHIATDDGSEGTAGFANTLSDALIAQETYDYVAICGPLPMERACLSAAVDAGVACEVSMEKMMACGVGACLGCVIKTTGGLKRCCVDGPVFDASEVIWQ
jgi:dihydroorotate dehydrogenase electron transfer subunit